MSKFHSDWIERNIYYKQIPSKTLDEQGKSIPHYTQIERRVIVCLVGSTRFGDAYKNAMRDETLAGKIVLGVGLLGHEEGIDMNGPVKKMLDELHLDKISLADEVLALNVGGYVGSSTRREILFAAQNGKTIRWLEPLRVPPDLAHLGDSLSASPKKE